MKTQHTIKPAIAIPARPPKGQRKSSPEYMRWYRAAKKAGLLTLRAKRTPEQRKAHRRKYLREYQRRYRARFADYAAGKLNMVAVKSKGNQE